MDILIKTLAGEGMAMRGKDFIGEISREEKKSLATSFEHLHKNIAFPGPISSLYHISNRLDKSELRASQAR